MTKKNNSGNKDCNFPQAKKLTQMAQICPKRNLGLEIQKTNVGIRINIHEIPCVPIFWQNKQL